MKISADYSNAQAANLALSAIKDASFVDKDGTRKIRSSPYQHMAQELLRQVVEVSPEIQERTKRGLVYRSIFRWLRHKKYWESADQEGAFLGAMEVEIRRIQRRMADRQVLMFLSCRPGTLSEFRSVKVLDAQLYIMEWDEINDLNLEEFFKQVHFHTRDNPIFHKFERDRPIPKRLDFTPVLYKAQSFDPGGVTEAASRYLDIFRACLNMPVVSGRISYFRSSPKALTAMPPSPIYGVFDSSGEFETALFTIEDYDYKRLKIKENQVASTSEYLEKINAITERESANLLVRVISAYQEALDIHSREVSYLAFWRVLEAAVDVFGEGLSQSKIESRIAALINPDPMLRSLIRVIVKKRNEYVHTGSFPVEGDPLLFSLKLIADISISRLISLASEFPTMRHIDRFLTYATRNDSDLEISNEIIEGLLSQRNSKS